MRDRAGLQEGARRAGVVRKELFGACADAVAVGEGELDLALGGSGLVFGAGPEPAGHCG